MNIPSVSAHLKNKEFLKTVGVFLGCVGLLIALYAFLVAPKVKKVVTLRSGLAALEVKARQYGDFKEFNGNIGNQREHIVDTLRALGVENMLTDKTDQRIFEVLGRICEKADVRLGKINQSKLDNGQQAWDISFKAPFDRIVPFMSLLEQAFKIDTFRIVSGRKAAVHTVTMIIYPIDAPSTAPADAASGKDLFDMYNEIEASLKGLESVLRADVISRQVRKDPLAYGDTVAPAEKKELPIPENVPKEKASSEQRPAIEVEDIFWDPETPLVAIGGKVCREGDTVGDFLVVKIREKSVDVKWQSRIYTLEPNKEVK